MPTPAAIFPVGSALAPTSRARSGQGPALPRSAALSRIPLLSFVLVCSLAAPRAAAEATIEGKVPLPATRAAVVVVNQRYEIVANAGILSTNPPVAVVYLEGAFPRPASPASFEIAQKDMTFLPALLPLQAGNRVTFPNFDDTYHNIFSFSPAKRFDLGRYRPDERPIPSVLFDTPGLVVLRCDIHDHMRALILVLDTPHFVLTDGEGNFRLPGLPAGKYTLKVWLNSKTTLERPVELVDGGTLRADFP